MNEDCDEIRRSRGGWPDLQGKCSRHEPFGVARILTLDKSSWRRYRKIRSMPSKSPWKFDFMLVTFWIVVILGAGQASAEPIPVTSLRPTPDLSIANISVNSTEELVCPLQCSGRGCYANGQCCHEQCFGGCDGPEQNQCFACKHLEHGRNCVEECPPRTLKYQNRRCVTKKECYKMSRSKNGSEPGSRSQSWKPFNNTICLTECPSGYEEVTIHIIHGKATKCQKCSGRCRKICTTAFVDSIESAKKLKGCVVIKGSLDIQIRNEMNVTNELEENLSAIEVITEYLKISKSFPLVSLRFLRKLRVIKGKTLESSKYALMVRDNENLVELWDWGARKPDGELRIERGQMFFHFNPKLCVNTIKQLQVKLGDRFEHVDDLDVGRKSNGHEVACDDTDVVGNKSSDPYSFLVTTNMYWIAVVLVLCVIVLAVVSIIIPLLYVYSYHKNLLNRPQPCSTALAPCSAAHNQSSAAHSSGSAAHKPGSRAHKPGSTAHNPCYRINCDSRLGDKWEILRRDLEIFEVLGRGSFGTVFRGTWLDNNGVKVPCAVKTVIGNASVATQRDFIAETDIMKEISSTHIVQLYGVVSQGQPAYVLMELMSKGDLRSFLLRNRPEMSLSTHTIPLTLKDILRMAVDIADGMAYLTSNKYVHRDLAARNCLVNEHNVVKIGDFGLAKDIYQTNCYVDKNERVLPVRWMAPESIAEGIYTSSSDVWSYGVVLWEMVTFAALPYRGIEMIAPYICSGGIMEKPIGCPENLYFNMKLCWSYKPADRPTFVQLIEVFLPHAREDFAQHSFYHNDLERSETS